MATATNTRRARDARGRTPDSAASARPWIIGGLVTVLAMVGVAVWLVNRRDRAAELIARQRELVASGGRLRSADIDAFIRDADRLSRAEARAVWAALGAEWQRLKRESVDRYFAAPDSERPALLDDDIARLRKYHRLLASLNPMDMPGGPVWAPRGPRPVREARRSAEEEEADRERKKLVALYDAARAARAKERGIELPQFR